MSFYLNTWVAHGYNIQLTQKQYFWNEISFLLKILYFALTHLGIIILLCITLSTVVLILLLITGLLLVLLLKKNSQTNNKGSCSSVVTTSNKTDIIASTVTDVSCKPNIAHELSISVTADYLYIVPPWTYTCNCTFTIAYTYLHSCNNVIWSVKWRSIISTS